jgi:hypothetical protein
MLSLGKERLSGRVSVEDIPSGHRHLTSIMEAMTENCEIVIGYRKYTSDQTSSYTIRPYAVKEFAKRWYIVGHCVERNGTRVYGLDRIMDLEITDRKFKMPKDFASDVLVEEYKKLYPNLKIDEKKLEKPVRKNEVLLTYKGETKPLAEWARMVGINGRTLYYRIKIMGWSVEKALETPTKTTGNGKKKEGVKDA